MSADSEGTAATYGGKGFRPRVDSHLEDVRAGVIWAKCGVRSEVGTLRAVLLAWPGEEVQSEDDPNEKLMLGHIELARLRRETEAIAAFYERQGVAVHVVRPRLRPPPNFIFMRDLFFLTPEGAVLARMATEQRAGEERFAIAALAEVGVPVLMTPRGNALFEGADALWLDAHTVLVGVGQRTNRAGYEQLSRLLAEMGVETISVDVPRGAQHLLGIVNLVDHDLAVLHADHASADLRQLLHARGLRCIQLARSSERDVLRAMNFVTLSPRQILMPAGCPATRALFVDAGMICHEIEVHQYVRGGGALGCLTAILTRDWQSPREQLRIDPVPEARVGQETMGTTQGVFTMLETLVACPACDRHVSISEMACPFCNSALPQTVIGQVVPPATSQMTRDEVYTFADKVKAGIGSAAPPYGSSPDRAVVPIYSDPRAIFDIGSTVQPYGSPPTRVVSAEPASHAFEVAFPNGAVVRVKAGFDAEALGKLLAVVSRMPG